MTYEAYQRSLESLYFNTGQPTLEELTPHLSIDQRSIIKSGAVQYFALPPLVYEKAIHTVLWLPDLETVEFAYTSCDGSNTFGREATDFAQQYWPNKLHAKRRDGHRNVVYTLEDPSRLDTSGYPNCLLLHLYCQINDRTEEDGSLEHLVRPIKLIFCTPSHIKAREMDMLCGLRVHLCSLCGHTLSLTKCQNCDIIFKDHKSRACFAHVKASPAVIEAFEKEGHVFALN